MKMRLIAADKLERDLESLKQDYEDEGCDSKRIDGIDDCIEEIGYTEPIDAVPVMHAHWIVIDEDSEGDEVGSHYWATLKCSRCGLERETEDGYLPEYCEGCGAKMDS